MKNNINLNNNDTLAHEYIERGKVFLMMERLKKHLKILIKPFS